MLQSNRFSRAVVCAALIIAGYGATVVAQNNPPQGQPQPARALKIGVVDIGELFKTYKRKDQLEEQINQQRTQLKAQLDREHEELKRARAAFQNNQFVEGSEPWLEERDRLRMMQQALEYKEQRMQVVLKRRVEEFTLQILTEIEGTIADYGARYGYDLILKTDKKQPRNEGQQGQQGQQGSLQEEFQERIFRAQISDVLFVKSDRDITAGVQQYMNGDANLAKWAQPATVPPAPPRGN